MAMPPAGDPYGEQYYEVMSSFGEIFKRLFDMVFCPVLFFDV